MRKLSIDIPESQEDFNKLLRTTDAEFLCVPGSGYKYINWVKEYFLAGGYGSYSLDAHLIRTYNLIDNMSDPDENYSEEVNSNYPYPCIPLSPSRFLELVAKGCKLFGNGSPRFIDAGCGVGDKVKLASMFFNDCAGVDYNNLMYKIATCRSFGEIFLGDITTFNFSEYGVIYAYNPMQSSSGMLRFFNNVINTAKKGTICIFKNVDSGTEALSKVKRKFVQTQYEDIWILK